LNEFCSRFVTTFDWSAEPADGFLPLRAFKPSSSDRADRGRSIIRVTGPHVRQTFLNDVFTFLTEVGNAGRIVNTKTEKISRIQCGYEFRVDRTCSGIYNTTCVSDFR
jgi:hypothetical protein